MIVVVEGIDRVGKTTLCKMLSGLDDMIAFKDLYCKELTCMSGDVTRLAACSSMKSLIAMYKSMKQNSSTSNASITFDRFHLTEAVYGNIERHVSLDVSEGTFKAIDDMLCEFGDEYVLVLVYPTDLEWSEQKHGSSLSKHQDLFSKLFLESKCKHKIRTDFNELSGTFEYIRHLCEQGRK